MHPSTNDRMFVCCPFISFGVIIATKPEACPDHHYMCTQIVTVHHIRIHSELSEEVHSILWRFNHISRLCLGATNFQSRHMLLSSTYSHSSFLLIKMLMSPRSPFQKCWIPFSQFRNTLLLIPTEYDLLTFNQTKYICFQWKHERNNLKQRHSLVLGVQWNELVPFSSHRKGSVCLLGNMSVAQRTEQKNSRTLDI